jgi:CheY-like chemotaxis protein
MRKLTCPKIFVVEDDKDIRELLGEALNGEGFGVESFSDGQKAIDRLYASPEPCLILLDMLMPIMNGEQFMHHFHRLPATILPIPVFLVSATCNETQSKEIGCRGFIKKPVDLEALLLIVGKYCETQTAFAAENSSVSRNNAGTLPEQPRL